MTNILRDVAEDAAVGRIYLPIEDLRKFASARGLWLENRAAILLLSCASRQAEPARFCRRSPRSSGRRRRLPQTRRTYAHDL